MSVAYALRRCWFIRGSRNVITMQHFVSNALVARNGDCSKKISWSICQVYKLNKEVVIEPTEEDAMSAIFGSDIRLSKGGVAIQTF